MSNCSYLLFLSKEMISKAARTAIVENISRNNKIDELKEDEEEFIWMRKTMENGLGNPMVLKKRLAHEIVGQFNVL